jgi:hypothetical protein
MYIGSWKIDDYLTFVVNTHLASTGAASDADGVPAYRVYEDETTTPILTGNMALLDGDNSVGFYSEQIQLTAANGFEKGKCYTIYITATVSSIAGTVSRTFQVEAEVDANIVSDKTGYSISGTKTTLDALSGTDGDTLKTLSEQIDAITVANIVNGVFDAVIDGHVTAGTFGELLAVLRNSGMVDEIAVYATGAVSAQAITTAMASSNSCIQYWTLKYSPDLNFASPDKTRYILARYDANGKLVEKKPSTTTTW